MTDDPTRSEPRPIPLPSARRHPFDPPPELGQLREQSAVHRLAYPDGHHGWLVTRHALVRKVLADPRFSARSELKRAPVLRPGADPFYGQPALPGWLVDMDPPDHTRYRRLLSDRFSMRRMKELQPRIEQIVEEHLAEMERVGPPADLVESFALPVPSLAICELLGVPYEDRREFQHNSAVLFSLEVSAEEAAASMVKLTDFLRALVRQKRERPCDDLLSELAIRDDFDDEELAGLGVLLLTAGHETSASMLGLGTFALLSHPEQLALLRDNPALVDNAVEELLRYLTIFQFGVPRTPLEDVVLEGHLIRAGESVTLSLPAANRDPRQFEAPDKLDITRPVRGHVAFGFGIHQCIGQTLARVEMRVGYPALLRRFPTLRLAVPSEEVVLSSDAGFYGVHRLLVAW
ncbi:cytochrome P450 [Sorangium sp. So ce1128]|uniref:Cytochrome P450 n=1 Tax=Sorangium cellulosum TaxID=56 RepID=A0A3S7UZV6_SORCE|nr:cytochrome P450 [Sorangium cellulosum]